MAPGNFINFKTWLETHGETPDQGDVARMAELLWNEFQRRLQTNELDSSWKIDLGALTLKDRDGQDLTYEILGGQAIFLAQTSQKQGSQYFTFNGSGRREGNKGFCTVMVGVARNLNPESIMLESIFGSDEDDDEERYQQRIAADKKAKLATPGMQKAITVAARRWQQVKPHFMSEVVFTLNHEIGHPMLKAGGISANLRTINPLPKGGDARYARSPKEWDTNVHVILAVYNSLSPQEKQSMTYDQLISRAVPGMYKQIYFTTPLRRKQMILRLQREGIVLRS